MGSSDITIKMTMPTPAYLILTLFFIHVAVATSYASGPQQRRTSVTKNVLGPVSKLKVANKVISPDGYARS